MKLPNSKSRKEKEARKKAYEQACAQYNTVVHLIYEFFGDIVFARENRLPLEEMAKIKKNMINKRPVLENLFREFLLLLGRDKIKNVKNLYSASEIFKATRDQLINVVCAEPDLKHESFYRYTLYSFYIIQSKMLDAMERNGFNYPALGLFFEESYSGIYYLLTLYADNIGYKLYHKSIASSRCGKSGYKHISQLLGIIGHTLYAGTPLDNGEAAPGETAMLCIRHYIEVWLRLTFNAWYEKNGQFIKVSSIFETLKNNMSQIKNDPKMAQLPDFEKIINILLQIYKGANYYTHSHQRQLFWVPHIIYMYLQVIYGKYVNFYQKISGKWDIHPGIVPIDCECYQKLYDELHR